MTHPPRIRLALALPSLVLLLGAVCIPALAQVPTPDDLSGQWTLSATGLLPEQNLPCVFEGSGQMTQNGSQLTGQATLLLVEGPDACPGEMMADLDGSLDGLFFGGTLDGGEMFGVLDFSGQVSQDGRMISGDYTVRDGGPFQGTDGQWSSERLLSVLAIPTLSGSALLVLALLLLGAAFFTLRRHRTA